MNEALPRISAANVLGAVGCLGAVPLGGAWFCLTPERPTQAFLEGGWPMYAIVLVAALGSLVAAAGVLLVNRAPILCAVALGCSVACTAVGTFGYAHGLRVASVAVKHAALQDQPTILNAANAEALQCVALSGAMTAAMLVLLGLGLIVSGLSTSQRALWVWGTGLVFLGGWAAWATRVSASLAEIHRAIAMADITDRLAVVMAFGESMQRQKVFDRVCLAGVLVSLLGALVLLKGSSPRRPIIALAIALPTIGLGAMHVLARPSLEQSMRMEGDDRRLTVFRGVGNSDHMPFLSMRPMVGAANEPRVGLNETVINRARDEDGAVRLLLEPDEPNVSFFSFARELAKHDVSRVWLVGASPVTIPRGFPLGSAMEHFVVPLAAVPVRIDSRDACNDRPCTIAWYDEHALHVDDEVFPYRPELPLPEDTGWNAKTVWHLKYGPSSTDRIIQAAREAVLHDAVLSIRLQFD